VAIWQIEASLCLGDIRDAVASIEQFTKDMDFDAFRQDPKTIAAVERKLQVISEAAVRLGEQAETLCPGWPWRNIRGLGTGSGINMIASISKPCGILSRLICLR